MGTVGTKTRHKGIMRYDNPKNQTHGYYVRVIWKKQRHSKFFSDGKYGDRLGALDAALQWRNETEKRIGKPRTDRLVIGIPTGVSQKLGLRRIKSGHTEYWEATWSPYIGLIQRTRYSITKHGNRGALRLAQKAREVGERQRQLSEPERVARRQRISPAVGD